MEDATVSGMGDSDARDTLANNIRHLIAVWADEHNHGKRSLNAWAQAHKIDVKKAQRAESGEYATTFRSLQHIADRLGIDPWQLLHPEPKARVLSPRARSIATMFDALTDEGRRRQAYALIVQILEFGNTGGSDDSADDGGPIDGPPPGPQRHLESAPL